MATKCVRRKSYVSGDKLGVRCHSEKKHAELGLCIGSAESGLRITMDAVCSDCECRETPSLLNRKKKKT